MLLRLTADLLSGSRSSPRLLILMYHRVLEASDPFLPDDINREEFTAQMQVLKRDYRTFTLAEAARRLAEHSLPRRSVVVTFDDGYRDNCENALPILAEQGIPATFFVASGFLGSGRMWNDTVIEALRRADAGELDLSASGLGKHTIAGDPDRVKAMNTLIRALKYHSMEERQALVDELAAVVGKPLPDDLMMAPKQVRKLFDAGMEIGGHTCQHPILSNIDTDSAEREIVSGRDALQEITGARVSSFAYPNGNPGRDYRREHVEILRRNGFDTAVSTAWGCATAASDPLQLPRIAPWDRTPLKYNLRLLRAYRQADADSV